MTMPLKIVWLNRPCSCTVNPNVGKGYFGSNWAVVY